MSGPRYSFDILAEAACCLWEALVDWQARDIANDWTARRDHVGTAQARHDCIGLAELCCIAWDALSEEEQHGLIPYDWEFCPAFLRAIDPDELPATHGPSFDALIDRLRVASATETERQNTAAKGACTP